MPEDNSPDSAGLYSFKAKDINGGEVSLSDYAGKVILIVNVASKCGFTGQYAGLENIYRKYRDRGLVILGFPANDFLAQEPGSDEEIRKFCTLNYGVSFPMFSKITVKGKDIHPIYAFLISKETNPDYHGAISWNFNKFLIGRKGRIRARFGSRTSPDNAKFIAAVEQALDAAD